MTQFLTTPVPVHPGDILFRQKLSEQNARLAQQVIDIDIPEVAIHTQIRCYSTKTGRLLGTITENPNQEIHLNRRPQANAASALEILSRLTTAEADDPGLRLWNGRHFAHVATFHGCKFLRSLENDKPRYILWANQRHYEFSKVSPKQGKARHSVDIKEIWSGTTPVTKKIGSRAALASALRLSFTKLHQQTEQSAHEIIGEERLLASLDTVEIDEWDIPATWKLHAADIGRQEPIALSGQGLVATALARPDLNLIYSSKISLLGAQQNTFATVTCSDYGTFTGERLFSDGQRETDQSLGPKLIPWALTHPEIRQRQVQGRTKIYRRQLLDHVADLPAGYTAWELSFDARRKEHLERINKMFRQWLVFSSRDTLLFRIQYQDEGESKSWHLIRADAHRGRDHATAGKLCNAIRRHVAEYTTKEERVIARALNPNFLLGLLNR